MAQEVLDHFGRVDVLVVNVGIGVGGVERRTPTAYAQSLLRAVPLFRALAPAVVLRTQARRSGRTEAALSASSVPR